MTVMPQKNNQTGFLGTSKPIPVWLQFVPGIVLDVVINDESPSYQTDRDINSVIAKPHISPNDGLKLKGVNKTRYYPLFRGFTDTPIKGDQVLLCTFGGVNYYMGPVNTTNSPNWNIDHINIRNSSELGSVAKSTDGSKGLSKYGLPLTFPTSEDIKRLQKQYNLKLDDFNSKFFGFAGSAYRLGALHRRLC